MWNGLKSCGLFWYLIIHDVYTFLSILFLDYESKTGKIRNKVTSKNQLDEGQERTEGAD